MALSVEEARKVATAFLEEYNGNIPLDLVVVDRQEDIYGSEATAEKIGRIDGAYHAATGRITLIASSLGDLQSARRTLRHELLGHYGLNTFKPVEKRALLDRVLETRSEESLASIWTQVDRDYGDRPDLHKAEEVFAFVAEEERSFSSRAWDRVRAGLQRALRRAGLSDKPLTLPELRAAAQRIAIGIRQGQAIQQTFPKTDMDQFRKGSVPEHMENSMTKPHSQIVAEEMIRHMEAGTARWQKPWKAGVVRQQPFNPQTGRDYRGVNAWWLDLQGFEDPRWLTYRQAQAVDAQVRKGERSTVVEYWQWSERHPMVDGDGRPVFDENSAQRTREVRLQRPKVFHARVFNAQQVDGLERYQAPAPSFEPVQRAEAVLAASGIRIEHDQNDRAFYRPNTDSIHLPDKAAFGTAAEYYATALHELGHGTGHKSRLAREFGPFGSEKYAIEELRAEMASFMATTEMGLGHYPERHAGYMENWLKVLKDDRSELFRAARDAETIRTWIQEPMKRQEMEKAAQAGLAVQQEQSQTQRQEEKRTMVQGMELSNSKNGAIGERIEAMQEAEKQGTDKAQESRERVYLDVPYEEKNQAKAAGAKWDRRAKSWYAPEGVDRAALQRWEKRAKAAEPSVDPVTEFAAALKEHGLILKGAPIMDGQWHTVPVEGNRKGKKSGSYKAWNDERPTGLIQNYKAGGTPVKWVATGRKIDSAERARLQAEIRERQAQRELALKARHDKVAKQSYGVWKNAAGAATHPYLEWKGVEANGLRVDRNGNLLVPLRDETGFLWNVQKITPEGAKYFMENGRMTGLMYELPQDGKRDDRKPMIIAEGFATAADIKKETGLPVTVAFNAGNLAPVAEAIRKKWPDRPIVIAADNDHKTEINGVKVNVGLESAQKAAQAVGATVIAPRWTEAEKAKDLTDFNDLRKERGAAELKKELSEQLREVLKQPARTRVQERDRVAEAGIAI